MMRRLFVILAFVLISANTYAHCTWRHPGHCARDVVEAPVKVPAQIVRETGKVIGRAGGEVGKVGKAVAKAADDVNRTHEKAVSDVSATLEKATKDTDRTVRKAGRNLNDAAIAIGHYMERQAQGVGETLSDAEKRAREGKFVDAIWHLGTDPIKHTEENAAKLTQESTLVNALAQVAATAYGGPQGAAAYSAWYTYRVTGDAEMALRVGLTVGATAAAMGAASDMPTTTVGELAKKAAVTGAIGGIGVAASGGDEEAIYEGFLRGGGMVLIQDGYKSYTGHDIDPRGAEGDAYCLTPQE